MIKEFEDALKNWNHLLEMNESELESTLTKMKTAQRLIQDYNDGIMWVQQPDDIFVIAQDVQNLWRDVIRVVEEAIKYQECVRTSYCKM